MTIASLKELDKLIALCQKRGVTSIEVDGIKLQLTPKAVKHSIQAPTLPDYSQDFPEAIVPVPKFTGEIEAPTAPETDELTPEQLMFYSAQGHTEVGQQ